MAGYSGFSMSNNAVAAYQDGEKPLSKWTKRDILNAIIDAIHEGGLILSCSLEKLKKIPVKELKKLCLFRSSWHHTSSYYNTTDFYTLDVGAVENLTNSELDKILADSKKEEIKEQVVEEKWECAFLEWGGTRKHPTAKEVVEEGIVKGEWFFRSDGSKKKITAKGFRFLRKIQ